MGDGAPLTKVDGDRKFFLLEDLRNLTLSGQARAHSLFDHDDFVEAHGQFVGINRDTGSADGAHDPSPVGIFSKEGGFDQVGSGDRGRQIGRAHV